MTPLQALITGAIAGSLVKLSDEETIAINVDVRLDSDGNYKPQVLVTGRNSGEELLVAVISLKEGP